MAIPVQDAQQFALLAEELVKSRSVADGVIRKTGVGDTADLALAHAVSPLGTVNRAAPPNPHIDDGLPPATPSGVTAQPIIHGLVISWNYPADDDKVKFAEIRLTPSGGSPTVYLASTIEGDTILKLTPDVSHSVEVRFTDAFTESSNWSAAIFATPLKSAAEEIDFGFADVFGELGFTNIEELNDPDKLGDDVVTGRAIITHDAAEFNLWAANAMIQSAKINTMVVDKLVGGVLDTTDLYVASDIHLAAGGHLYAGTHTTIDDGGMTMTPAANYNTPAMAADQKISAEGDWVALGFYDDTTLNIRGGVLRSDGDGTTKKGQVALVATTDGNILDTGRAVVNVQSANPPLNVNGTVFIYDDCRINNNFYVDNDTTIGRRLIGDEFASVSVVNGATQNFNHTVGAIPFYVRVQRNTTGSTWQDVVNGVGGWTVNITSTQVQVTNASGATWTIRAMVIG